MAAPDAFGSLPDLATRRSHRLARPTHDDAGTNSVLAKAQAILEAFEIDDVELSLRELSDRSGIARATVHRLAGELVGWGVLERQGSGYRLGIRLFELGQRVPSQRLLRAAARPVMEQLLDATSATIHLAIRDGLELIYVEKICWRGVSRPSRVAGRMPLHCTATGRALLAFGPAEVVTEVLSRPLERLTPFTATSPAQVLRELERARAVGYAVEIEQVRPGFLSVGVPLYGPTGTLIAALSMTSPVFDGEPQRFGQLLRQVSGQVTDRLRQAG